MSGDPDYSLTARRGERVNNDLRRWRDEFVRMVEDGKDPEAAVDEVFGRLVQVARRKAEKEYGEGAIPINEMLTDRAAFQPIINGALRTTIDSHGPITKEWIGSASKRIWGQFKGYLKEVRDRHARKKGLGEWRPQPEHERTYRCPECGFETDDPIRDDDGNPVCARHSLHGGVNAGEISDGAVTMEVAGDE